MRTDTRRLVAPVCAFALVGAMVAGCAPKNEGEETNGGTEPKEPYRIGAILSLTGTYAGLGAPEKNTLEMEVERINAAGGVDGHLIEIVYEDDATDAAKAQAAAVRLIEQEDVVAIIGATGTGQSMAMRADIARAGIPQLSIAGGTVITKDFSEWVFQTPWSNSLVVPFTLDYLKGKGITRIALVTDTGGFGADGLAVLQEESSKAGLTVVESQTFNPGDTDMTGQLTKIKASDAQAVVLWNAGKEAAIVAKNMQQLNMGLPLFGGHGNARSEFIEGAGSAAEGFRFAAGKVLSPASYGEGTESYNVVTDFIDRYTERYSKGPDTFAGHAYDALHLIVEALGRLDEGFSPEDLRAEIEATSGFVGICGVFTFSPTDHNGLSEGDLVMYEVKNGEWVLAE
jgi:branched-chain amino acid transport system substrate-binding protein